MDFVAAQCLVSISNRAAVPEHGGAPDAERLRLPECEVTKEHGDPGDTWKDYCTLVTIAKSLLDLNKYRPIQTPSVCSDSLESPDEDMGSDSDVTTESGSSPSHSPEERQDPGSAPSPLSLLHPGVAAKGNTPPKRGTSAPTVAVGKSMENPPISKPITECIQVSGVSLSSPTLGLVNLWPGSLPGCGVFHAWPKGCKILDELLFNSLK